jgi:hypothetical protein
MKKQALLWAFATVLVAGSWGQMTPRPECSREANSDWYELATLSVGDVLQTRFEQDYWMPDGYTTTLLPAEGAAPAAPDFEQTDDPELAEYEYRNELAEWSCMYGPRRAVDGDMTTAWSEGAPGAGEGEVLVVPLTANKMEIWTGFGLSERLHKRNGRPAVVELSVLQALTGMANQFDLTIEHLVLLAKGDVTLSDTNGYQPLPLPRFSPVRDSETVAELLAPFFDDEVPSWALYPGEPEDALFLAIRIVSVYPGSAYEDTLISEVRARK